MVCILPGKPEFAGYCRKMQDSVVNNNQLFSAPPEGLYIQPGEVKYPVCNRSCKLLNGFWLAIKGWAGRTNNTASQCYRFHISDMDKVIGSVPDHADQSSSFLQNYIGSPRDKIVRKPASNAAQRAHGAGYYDHRIVLSRS